MIHLSPAAIAEVNRIRSKHTNPNAIFRLGVKSGGCADLYYTMELDETLDGALDGTLNGTIAPEQQIHYSNGMSIAIDPDSLKYLDGLKIDYTEDLMGGGFRFHNPNAVSSCGCGNSFSVNPK